MSLVGVSPSIGSAFIVLGIAAEELVLLVEVVPPLGAAVGEHVGDDPSRRSLGMQVGARGIVGQGVGQGDSPGRVDDRGGGEGLASPEDAAVVERADPPGRRLEHLAGHRAVIPGQGDGQSGDPLFKQAGRIAPGRAGRSQGDGLPEASP